MPQENCHVKVRGLATKFTWVESRKQFRAPDRKLYWEVEGKGTHLHMHAHTHTRSHS